MKPGLKVGQTRKSPNAGKDKGLAKRIGTPEGEYEEAIRVGVTHPASGVPDYEALAEHGLTRDLFAERRLKF